MLYVLDASFLFFCSIGNEYGIVMARVSIFYFCFIFWVSNCSLLGMNYFVRILSDFTSFVSCLNMPFLLAKIRIKSTKSKKNLKFGVH